LSGGKVQRNAAGDPVRNELWAGVAPVQRAIELNSKLQLRRIVGLINAMLFPVGQPVKRVLCLGAHADDIEIGCGGTLLRLIAADPSLTIEWHVFSATGPRRKEARASAAAFLSGLKRGGGKIATHAFRESYFPQDWAGIKDEFERIKRRFDPDVIFTQAREDRHQDHRVLSDLAWNTFRNHPILEYEIPKYDGDLGQPNYYVALDEATVRRKVTLLLEKFPTQARRHWFTEETFRGLMRIRGIECGPRAHYAEAFYLRKWVA
jgi:LmbE family N-acetylglucosaminyl deacetylase